MVQNDGPKHSNDEALITRKWRYTQWMFDQTAVSGFKLQPATG